MKRTRFTEKLVKESHSNIYKEDLTLRAYASVTKKSKDLTVRAYVSCCQKSKDLAVRAYSSVIKKSKERTLLRLVYM